MSGVDSFHLPEHRIDRSSQRSNELQRAIALRLSKYPKAVTAREKADNCIAMLNDWWVGSGHLIEDAG